MDGFTDAYVIATGEKTRIPEHWIDHPVLGVPFRKTPSARKAAEGPKKSATPAPIEGKKE